MRCPWCGCASVPERTPSPMQGRVLDYIMRFHDETGWFPNYYEIAEAFGLRAHSTAAEHVYKLAAKGWVTLKRGHAGRGRAIKAARRSA